MSLKIKYFGIILLLLFSCNNNSEKNTTTKNVEKQNWKLASSFPKSLNSFWERVEGFSSNVNLLSDEELTIKAYQPGELIPALEVFDAVSQGSIEMGITAGAYYMGKDNSLILESGIPFGLNARQRNAWLYEYGGIKLLQELYKKYNIMYFPIGNTGTQMGGWFTEEVNSLEDLKGLRIRAAGMAGKVYSNLGANIQMVSGGEIYSSLEQGAIDGAEFIGPYDDEQFGFQEVAKYYYAPGWGEPGTSIALYINIDKWNSLSDKAKKIIEIASKESNLMMLSKYDKENAEAMVRLIDKGVQFKRFSNDILIEAKKESDKILIEYAKNKEFNKIYKSIQEFKGKSTSWFNTNEFYLMDFEAKK